MILIILYISIKFYVYHLNNRFILLLLEHVHTHTQRRTYYYFFNYKKIKSYSIKCSIKLLRSIDLSITDKVEMDVHML